MKSHWNVVLYSSLLLVKTWILLRPRCVCVCVCLFVCVCVCVLVCVIRPASILLCNIIIEWERANLVVSMAWANVFICDGHFTYCNVICASNFACALIMNFTDV